ncbi:uncharacterized protein V6R79_014754 [Siganus canaliculatus]
MEFKAIKTSGDAASSIDGKHNTCGPTMPHVVKKKRRACGLTRGIAPEFNSEYEGVNGYVYTVKYHDGHVTLCVKSVSEEQGFNADLSVKDWKLFRTVACRDLDHPGFPEVLYVSQWSSGSGPEMYRIEADRFLRLSDDFIFLSVCEDREPMIASRGQEEWKLQPYPLTNQEYDAHFKTSFFIQWCDWGYLQGVFSKVDDAIKRDRVARSYESIRKRLDFGHLSIDKPSTVLPALCRPKIITHLDYYA